MFYLHKVYLHKTFHRHVRACAEELLIEADRMLSEANEGRSCKQKQKLFQTSVQIHFLPLKSSLPAVNT